MPDAIAPLQPSRSEILFSARVRVDCLRTPYTKYQPGCPSSIRRKIQQSVTTRGAMAPRVQELRGQRLAGSRSRTSRVTCRSMSGPLFRLRTRRAAAQHLDLSETAGRSSYGCWSAKGSGIASTEGKRCTSEIEIKKKVNSCRAISL
jgi:hypothetical protein